MTDKKHIAEKPLNDGYSKTLRLKDGWDMKKPTSTMSQVLKKEEILLNLTKLESIYPKLFNRNNGSICIKVPNAT